MRQLKIFVSIVLLAMSVSALADPAPVCPPPGQIKQVTLSGTQHDGVFWLATSSDVVLFKNRPWGIAVGGITADSSADALAQGRKYLPRAHSPLSRSAIRDNDMWGCVYPISLSVVAVAVTPALDMPTDLNTQIKPNATAAMHFMHR